MLMVQLPHFENCGLELDSVALMRWSLVLEATDAALSLSLELAFVSAARLIPGS